MDNDLLQAQKVQILGELTKGLDRLKEAGFGEVMNFEKEGLKRVDVDLTIYPFIEEDAKAYMNDEQYFIVSSENVLLYLGNIDKDDQGQTIMKDFISFPRLAEVTILLGKGEVGKVEEKFDDSHYFMAYCGEVFGGMIKAHENGHIDIEEEMKKALS